MLLLVTVVAVFLAREVHIVNERKAARSWLLEHGAQVVTVMMYPGGVLDAEKCRPRVWRSRMGDEGVVVIATFDWGPEKMEWIDRTLPEATIYSGTSTDGTPVPKNQPRRSK